MKFWPNLQLCELTQHEEYSLLAGSAAEDFVKGSML